MKTPSTDPIRSQLATFLEALRVWGYSRPTIKSYADSLRAFSGYLQEQEAEISGVLEVNSGTIRNYSLWLQKQTYAAWTIIARLQAVRRFFEHLETTQVILLSPCAGLEPPKLKRRLPNAVLTVEDAKRVLELPDVATPVGIRDRAILEVFYSSGIRLAEMACLTLADVDYANGFLRVNQGKGARDRVVPLGQCASAWVRRYVEEVRGRWNQATADPQALWLSSRSPYQAIKSQAIEVMVKHYGRRAGLPTRLTPHLWRHTCATHLVANGGNIAYVQRLLGHRSLRTTQVYVRTSISEIKTTHARAHPRNQPAAL